tara:strand:- start:56 stop:199 length:144 start_codon:yes stop_codon:yes gene_type:complete
MERHRIEKKEGKKKNRERGQEGVPNGQKRRNKNEGVRKKVERGSEEG